VSSPSKAIAARPVTAAIATVASTVRQRAPAVSRSTTGPRRARRARDINATCTIAHSAVESASPPTRSGVQISATLSRKFASTIHRLMRTGVTLSPSA
jgi:hypothetical protein